MWWDELNDPDYAPNYRKYGNKEETKYHYNSMTSNRPILNAISGEYYYYLKGEKKIPYRIGTRDQGRFYAVVMAQPGDPKESCKLFFDTPEQFETFTGMKVCEESRAAFQLRKHAFDMTNRYELRGR